MLAADLPKPAPAATAAPASDVFASAITLFGGKAVNASGFAETISGFQQYLTAVGVHAVSALDLTRPHHPNIAVRLGFRDFLPPRSWWPRGAALALLTERLERAAGGEVTVRNWWRPEAYNRDPGVGGAKNGDHPTANAVDLDYSSASARARAERFLRKLDGQEPWLGLSLGLGPETTHVGIGSARGRREWHYAGWTPAA